MLRALARLGVVHEPDFPAPVGVEVQLSKPRSAEAVDRYGPSMRVAMTRISDELTPEQMHIVRTANREERRELMLHLVPRERELAEDDD